MIKYNEKTRVLTFTGADEKMVKAYAIEHKLTFRDVVYLALMNGIAKGYYFDDKKVSAESTFRKYANKKVVDPKQVYSRGVTSNMAMVARKKKDKK